MLWRRLLSRELFVIENWDIEMNKNWLGSWDVLMER